MESDDDAFAFVDFEMAQQFLVSEESGSQQSRAALQTVDQEGEAPFRRADGTQVSAASSYSHASLVGDETHNLLPLANIARLLATQVPGRNPPQVGEEVSEYVRKCITELIGICCDEALLSERTSRGGNVPTLGKAQLLTSLTDLGTL